ncbi:hypothetical protein SERLA73DRAFT_150228 [Serpula lacrymans var. lacrymans S7.3]|uniref:Uncharacterized protein n=1 Tax=Serpula lacrymans var. lacrymans (strain S7.3) TaxID=936435 RepID=F8PLL8_SERL3|nr:hypothetical protein SERLA73DRAFT_150228 [Serpula lacrymans var. lacrymans S7.3]
MHKDKIVWFHSGMSAEFQKKTVKKLQVGALWGIHCTDTAGMVPDLRSIGLVVQWKYTPSLTKISRQKQGKEGKTKIKDNEEGEEMSDDSEGEEDCVVAMDIAVEKNTAYIQLVENFAQQTAAIMPPGTSQYIPSGCSNTEHKANAIDTYTNTRS